MLCVNGRSRLSAENLAVFLSGATPVAHRQPIEPPARIGFAVARGTFWQWDHGFTAVLSPRIFIRSSLSRGTGGILGRHVRSRTDTDALGIGGLAAVAAST